MGILDTQATGTEVVLQERVTTSEFKIIEIREFIQQRRVEVEIEFGPFTTEERPNGETVTRGTSRRGVTVWQGEEYDAVRDTWKNEDLMTAVASKV